MTRMTEWSRLMCRENCRTALIIIAVVSFVVARPGVAQVEAIYWVEESQDGAEVEWTIRRADPDGRNVTIVYQLQANRVDEMLGPLGPVVASNQLEALFFAEVRDQHHLEVVRTGTEGELPTTVFGYTAPFTGLVAFRVLGERRELAYVEDTVADGLRHRIQFISTDTGERRGNVDLPIWVNDFVVDERDDRLFLARPSGIDTHAAGIYRSDLSGSHIELIVEARPHTLALDTRQDRLYWSHPSDGIFRSYLNGRDVEHVVEGSSLWIGMEVDDGILYWIDSNTMTLYRANADDLLADRSASAQAIYVADRMISRPAVLAKKYDGIVTDSLDWRRYFPLDVGNEWHYIGSWDSLFDDFRREWQTVWRIIGDTLIENRNYFNLRMESFANDTLSGTPRIAHIRYHDEFDHIVVREREEDVWFELVPCGLGAPFINGWHQCAGIEDRVVEFTVGVEHDVELMFGPEIVRIPQMKSFGTLTTAMYMYSDIGFGSFSAGGWAEFYGWGLRFAQINGRTYGQRVISNEPALPRPDGFRIVSIYPNPVTHRATLEYAAPSTRPITIEVFDVLGRKVLETHPSDSMIGSRRLDLDFSNLAAGMYVLRLRSAHHGDSVLVTKL